MFSTLNHLNLCKPGRTFWGPDDFLGFIPDVEEQILQEFELWIAILRAVRQTIAVLVLEQRPVYDVEWIMGEDWSSHGRTRFNPDGFLDPKEDLFMHYLLQVAFKDEIVWPKLRTVLFRGINFTQIERTIGEPLKTFTSRTLPGVTIYEIEGDKMWHDSGYGTAIGCHNVDGLLPHLDPHQSPYGYDYEHKRDGSVYCL